MFINGVVPQDFFRSISDPKYPTPIGEYFTQFDYIPSAIDIGFDTWRELVHKVTACNIKFTSVYVCDDGAKFHTLEFGGQPVGYAVDSEVNPYKIIVHNLVGEKINKVFKENE